MSQFVPKKFLVIILLVISVILVSVIPTIQIFTTNKHGILFRIRLKGRTANEVVKIPLSSLLMPINICINGNIRHNVYT